jgi:hypothetical protein
MNTKYLVAIGATILVMAFLFSKENKEKITEENQDLAENSVASAQRTVPVSALSATNASSIDKTPAVTLPAAEVNQVNPKVAEFFAANLKYMNKCLGATSANAAVGESVAPTPDNLLNQLRSSLGDVVMQMDDWSQTEILDQDSKRKRVRVDYDYVDNANPTKRLSMYQINSYGMPEIMNLTAEEVNDPNQSYIDSLIEGNKVMSDEKGVRAYFAEGEELIYTVRNGQLQNISINHADKSFNCFNLDDEKSSCSCP